MTWRRLSFAAFALAAFALGAQTAAAQCTVSRDDPNWGLGTVFRLSTPQTIGGTASLSHLVINVKDCGAKGDGVTDDAPAFRNALAFAGTFANAPPVYAPAGVYVWNSGIVWNKIVSLRGDGTGTVFKFTPTTGTALTISPPVVTNVPNDYRFSDFRLLGSGFANNDTAVVIGGDYLQMERVGIGQQPTLPGETPGPNHGWGVGMTFSMTNVTFFFTAYAVDFQFATQALVWPAGAPQAENIRFMAGSFVNCQTFANGVLINGNVDIYFDTESFDGCQLAVTGAANVSVVNAHFETVNPLNPSVPMINHTTGQLAIYGGRLLLGSAAVNIPQAIASNDGGGTPASLYIHGLHAFAAAAIPAFLAISGGVSVSASYDIQGTWTNDYTGTTTGPMLVQRSNVPSLRTNLAFTDGAQATTCSTTPAIANGFGNYFTCNITANIAAVVQPPNFAIPAGQSQLITIALRNSSGGALGTAPTFSTAATGFKLGGLTIVNPANGTQVLYTWRWDPVQSFWYPAAAAPTAGS